MTKYTAIFKDGTEIVKTSKDFESRLAFYNWICENKLGKNHNGLKAIECKAMPR